MNEDKGIGSINYLLSGYTIDFSRWSADTAPVQVVADCAINWGPFYFYLLLSWAECDDWVVRPIFVNVGHSNRLVL